jgi:hypothetical protein
MLKILCIENYISSTVLKFLLLGTTGERDLALSRVFLFLPQKEFFFSASLRNNFSHKDPKALRKMLRIYFGDLNEMNFIKLQ